MTAELFDTESYERIVASGLLRHPELTASIAEFVRPIDFRDGYLRDVYTAEVVLGAHGGWQPVNDELLRRGRHGSDHEIVRLWSIDRGGEFIVPAPLVESAAALLADRAARRRWAVAFIEAREAVEKGADPERILRDLELAAAS